MSGKIAFYLWSVLAINWVPYTDKTVEPTKPVKPAKPKSICLTSVNVLYSNCYVSNIL